MKRPLWLITLTAAMIAASCSPASGFHYSGRLDVDPVTISAQALGVLQDFDVEEGETVQKGQSLGSIDDAKLLALRDQQAAQFSGFDARTKALEAQIEQAQAQLGLDRQTLVKTEKVLAQGGATVQARDELATKVQVESQTLQSLQANLKLLHSQEDELRAQVQQTQLSLHDTRVIAPLAGVILTKYHFTGELATVGTPLVQMADLSRLWVKIYVPLVELPQVKLNQEATVLVDGVAKGFPGRVSWISSEASFTPKTILTQETRTTLVYAVKIEVQNPDGVLKIGMPVEVTLP